MGRYTIYIWVAFGVTFLSMFVLLIFSVRQGRNLLIEIQAKVERKVHIEKLENTL
ncbi:heme exporter protein D [Candidatus Photodesmus blepharus]|uniref:Heme exporter protein D n=2 Tax=Candidatus Photodesmus blepharonis TaxID=1179155 RepID=A0A084CMX5_9GAMM|nr:heme exporter protein D [Candidatus Photodesmus blepharus]